MSHQQQTRAGLAILRVLGAVCVVGWALTPIGLAQPAAPAPAAPASPPVFRWQAGEQIRYKLEHITQASDTQPDGTTNHTATHLWLTRRWTVQAVEANGNARVQLTLEKLKIVITRPDKTQLAYDSEDTAMTQSELHKEMGRYVGGVLAELVVDPRGLVVNVVKSEHGPGSRFEADLPFKLTLPTVPLAEKQAWTRNYHITLEPPGGKGEKIPARQEYLCKGFNGTLALVHLRTQVEVPANFPAVEQIPLLTFQPEGDIFFNVQTGRYQGARLKVERELKNHRGEGSTFRYSSTFTEDLID